MLTADRTHARPRANAAVTHGIGLTIACLITYELVMHGLDDIHVSFPSRRRPHRLTAAPTCVNTVGGGRAYGTIGHMEPGAADPSPVIREFDGRALYAARDARGLANHPISPSTLQNLGKRSNTSCQHALFFLRWLDRTPESFLDGAAVDAGEPLPACGPDRRPRWDLKALHAGLNECRATRGATWAQTAHDLHCQPGQLTGLKTARYATGMTLAMRITQWVDRPAADFIYRARW